MEPPNTPPPLQLDDVASHVLALVAAQCAGRDIDVHSDLYFDLGLDSYMKVDLVLSIEAALSVELSDRAASDAATVADLILAVREASC